MIPHGWQMPASSAASTALASAALASTAVASSAFASVRDPSAMPALAASPSPASGKATEPQKPPPHASIVASGLASVSDASSGSFVLPQGLFPHSNDPSMSDVSDASEGVAGPS